MKHLKLLPLLIAAVLVMPRAHAASPGASAAPVGGISSNAALIAAFSLLALVRRRPRNEIFKYQSEL